MTLTTARRHSRQQPIGITRRTGNWAPHASGPTRYSPRLLSSGISPWRIRRSAFREEVSPPLLVRFARRRAAAPAARQGRRVPGAPRSRSLHCVYKQTPGMPGRRCFDRQLDASRRRRRPALPRRNHNRAYLARYPRICFVNRAFPSLPIRSSKGNPRYARIFALNYNLYVQLRSTDLASVLSEISLNIK